MGLVTSSDFVNYLPFEVFRHLTTKGGPKYKVQIPQ